MDTNDYEFTVSRDGRRTTYKGSAALSETVRPELEADAAPQPKDWGMNIPIEVAVVEGPEAGPGEDAGLPRRDRRAVDGRRRQAGGGRDARRLGGRERPLAPPRGRDSAAVLAGLPREDLVRVAGRLGPRDAASVRASWHASRGTCARGRRSRSAALAVLVAAGLARAEGGRAQRDRSRSRPAGRSGAGLGRRPDRAAQAGPSGPTPRGPHGRESRRDRGRFPANAPAHLPRALRHVTDELAHGGAAPRGCAPDPRRATTR